MTEPVSQLFEKQPCYRTRLDISHSVNREVYEKILALQDQDIEKQSHYFHGRYENLYVSGQSVPGLDSILLQIKELIGQIFHLKQGQFKFGFWLNVMKPGHITTRHNHDDDDELLSGVYYIHVPEHSGNLYLFSDQLIEITPEESGVVLFSPRLDHEVGMNNSDEMRLSIGFNAGLS